MNVSGGNDLIREATDGRICVLPQALVNRISAGEVIERPASVVKELIDNAIDAGASRIALQIEEGGRRLIGVVDNGSGMGPEDLLLSVRPHATSKLRNDDDLYQVTTLGFRGEALASVAAVAKLRIASRLHGSDVGHEIDLQTDDAPATRAVGCPPGTSIEVRDLFYNVPVRRKFLRTAGTEMGHINEQFSRSALAYPGIAFELTNNGRLSQQLPVCAQRLGRIAHCFGSDLAEAMLCVTREERGLTIEAYAAPPAFSRATPQWQYLFVNGRYIRDRFLQFAVREAYRGLMEPNRHPVLFLFLRIDPALVDVNVHPTKIEVRWADSHLVHSQVLSALRETFQRSDLVPALRGGRGEPLADDRQRAEFVSLLKSAAPVTPGPYDPVSTRTFTVTEFAGRGFSGPGPGSDPSDPRFLPPGLNQPADDYSTRLPSPIPREFGMSGGPGRADRGAIGADVWGRLYGGPQSPNDPREPGAGAMTPDYDLASAGRKAVQMHNLYLVVEEDDGIVIIDQHALHERIMYDHLRHRLGTGSLESQRLLLPVEVQATQRQIAQLEAHPELLERLGIEWTPFGADSVAIHSFPVVLRETDVASFVHDLVDHLDQGPGDQSLEVLIHRVLDMLACRSAVKAGDVMSIHEVDALLRQADLVEKPTSCPHGRPTMLRLTKTELNRMFHRT